jgi:hypothetical protein
MSWNIVNFRIDCTCTSRYPECIIPLQHEMKVLVYPVLLEFPNGVAVLKVSRFRPFVFLLRATCIWRQLWSTGGAILRGENRSAREKNLTHCHTPQIAHAVTWYRTRASAVRGRRLPVWAMTQPSQHKYHVYSSIYQTRCNVTQFILSGNCSTCFG